MRKTQRQKKIKKNRATNSSSILLVEELIM